MMKIDRFVTRYGIDKMRSFEERVIKIRNDAEKLAYAYSVFGRDGAEILDALKEPRDEWARRFGLRNNSPLLQKFKDMLPSKIM